MASENKLKAGCASPPVARFISALNPKLDVSLFNPEGDSGMAIGLTSLSGNKTGRFRSPRLRSVSFLGNSR